MRPLPNNVLLNVATHYFFMIKSRRLLRKYNYARISNGIQNIGLQNLLFSFIDKSESGIASGLLMTSRFIGNILASSIYGVAFATGMSEQNMVKMTVVLLVVAVVLIPGMLFITAHERKQAVEN